MEFEHTVLIFVLQQLLRRTIIIMVAEMVLIYSFARNNTNAFAETLLIGITLNLHGPRYQLWRKKIILLGIRSWNC